MRILFLVLFATFIGVNCKMCQIEEKEEVKCDSTNYELYVDCERARLHGRSKRSICDDDCDDCEDSCDSCDCDECSGYSTSSCCNSCCTAHVCKTTSCCQRTCRASCKNTSCRSSCKKSCYNNLRSSTSRNVASKISSNTNVTAESENKHNITTIIHLNNIINTTNLIDVPISLNNTNINNITVLTETDSQAPIYPNIPAPNVIVSPSVNPSVIPPSVVPPQVVPPAVQPIIPQITPQIIPQGPTHYPIPIYQQPISPPQSGCCTVVGPRQCSQTDKFPFLNCHHYKTQECGDICKSNIMHIQPRQVCTSVPPSCKQEVAYIPQPEPRCSYQSSWPYVSCGIQQTSCEGCYGHYFESGNKQNEKCSSSCYDDGFGIGPIYRQGPFYRPGYSHVPSCLQTGLCGYDYSSGLGGFPYNGFPGYGGLGGYGGFGGLGGFLNPFYPSYYGNPSSNSTFLFGLNSTNPTLTSNISASLPIGIPFQFGPQAGFPSPYAQGLSPLASPLGYSPYSLGGSPLDFSSYSAGGNPLAGQPYSPFAPGLNSLTNPLAPGLGQASGTGIFGLGGLSQDEVDKLNKIFTKRAIKVEEPIAPPQINVGPIPFSMKTYPQFIAPDLEPIPKNPVIVATVTQENSDKQAEILISKLHPQHHHHGLHHGHQHLRKEIEKKKEA